MLNITAVRHVLASLACGEADEARTYLGRFAAPVRAQIKGAVREWCEPEVLALFDRRAPWLAGDAGDDLDERIREALREVEVRGAAISWLTARFRRVPVDLLRDRLDRMVGTREVVIERKRTAGRPAEVFRLARYAADVVPANRNQDPFAGPLMSELYGDDEKGEH